VGLVVLTHKIIRPASAAIDPFIVGTTKPQAVGDWTTGDRNVGPRFDYDPDDSSITPSNGIPWTVINGNWNITTPGDYYNYWVNGTISPKIAGVNLYDCVQRAPAITSAPTTQQFGLQIPSTVSPGGLGVTANFLDIGCPPANQNYSQSTAIRPHGVITTRCMTWGYVDAIMPYGPTAGTRGRFTDYGSSFSTGPHYAYDGGNHSDGSHNDGCQCEGNVGLNLNGTLLHGQYTSGILATNNVAGGYDFLHLYDCWIGAELGAKVNIAGSSIANIQILRCKLMYNLSSYDFIITTTNRDPSYFGMTGIVGNVNGWVPDGSGNHNVIEGTNTVCRFANG
jgi:hypothetical protein